MQILCRILYQKLTNPILTRSLKLTPKMADSLNREEDKNKVTFETLKFDNLALRTLPIDPIAENYVRQVKNAVFSRVN